ncbi:probable tRNA N6-adenosine threonylcarbamoyltransferase, mitochondrial [Culicoides brevitarsis]|uniref:probable tRNA N6-adenosine threonylcarbamoyltransferase, mitochondrial n=1 Tax=Culicoides brevitarsis TaxID=469753 RepID=UPI00307B25FE
MNIKTIFCNKFLNKSLVTSWNKSLRRQFCISSKTFERPFILGIETSCDDTGAAVVDAKGNILGDCVASQLRQHLAFGGIIPPVAAELHRQNIEKVVNTALSDSGLKIEEIDSIAVTNRPGLALSLSVGLRYAKHLARKHGKSLIPIHHMEAHALTVRMENDVPLPFLSLLVSGGHCLLSICKEIDKFLLLGESIDDAPGEAFDKIARRMKLRNLVEFRNMSGGQAIEIAASRADKSREFDFPLPLARSRDCQFSFSGLKNTANRFTYFQEREHGTAKDDVFPGYENLCLGLLKGITRHICHRTQRAIEFCEDQKILGENRILVVSGGVACNDFLFTAVSQLGEQYGYKVLRPRRKLCTDNGVMIAWNGIERYKIKSDVLENFEHVMPLGKCKLGESWLDKVSKRQLACKWAKIPILRDEE